MNGLKNILAKVGFHQDQDKTNLIHLLYLAGCFNKTQHGTKPNRDQLSDDLLAAGFTSEESDEICKLRNDNSDWDTFISNFNKYLTNDENTPDKLNKAQQWLFTVMKRAFLNKNNKEWMDNPAILQLTNDIKHIEILSLKQNLEAKYSVVLIPGDSIPKILDRSHALQLLMCDQYPITNLIYYIPTNRELSYAVDTETAIKQYLIHGINLKSECDFMQAIAEPTRQRIDQLLNSQKASAPAYQDANPDGSTPQSNSMVTQVFDSRQAENLEDALRLFAKTVQKERRFESILLISSKAEIDSHYHCAEKVFGTSVTLNAVVAPATPKEILHCLGRRAQKVFAQPKETKTIEKKSTSVLGMFAFGAVGLATVVGTAAAAVKNPQMVASLINRFKPE